MHKISIKLSVSKQFVTNTPNAGEVIKNQLVNNATQLMVQDNMFNFQSINLPIHPDTIVELRTYVANSLEMEKILSKIQEIKDVLPQEYIKLANDLLKIINTVHRE